VPSQLGAVRALTSDVVDESTLIDHMGVCAVGGYAHIPNARSLRLWCSSLGSGHRGASKRGILVADAVDAALDPDCWVVGGVLVRQRLHQAFASSTAALLVHVVGMV